MIVQLLFAKSSARTQEEWEKQAPIRKNVQTILRRQPGFIRLQPLWNLDCSREIVAIITWATQQDLEAFLKSTAFDDMKAVSMPLREGGLVSKAYVQGELS